MQKKKWIIATRNSPLALQQTTMIASAISEYHPSVTIEFYSLTTEGDKDLERPLVELGGKSLFVKELQTAVLEGRADLAVHSLKDMSVFVCPGLTLAAISVREDPRDVLISNRYSSFAELPYASMVGSCSPRRIAQMKSLRGDVQFRNLRGNIGTRLSKLDQGEYDAIVLAAAGLKRMNHAERIKEFFDIRKIIPAIGQGALGIECRQNDNEAMQLVSHVHDPRTALCVTAERAVNQELGGDCQTAIGAFAWLEEDKLHLLAMVGSQDGQLILRSYRYGNSQNAAEIGLQVAQDLIAQGALKLL
jgi:hydroxymethylbilane synthase